MSTSRILCVVLLFVSAASPAPVDPTPQQVHIVFGANESEYVVSWVTFEDSSEGTYSKVKYGLSASSLNRAAYGFPKLFVEYRCHTRRLMHDVVLGNLVPGSVIFYRVSSKGAVWSKVFNFTVFPRTLKNRTMVVSLSGDLTVPPICNVSSIDFWANETAKGNHDFILHLGDIAYDLDRQCNGYGDVFMNRAQSVSAYTSYVYAVGNHETDVQYTYRSYLARYAGLSSLAKASRSPSIRWFSFDAQLVHFVFFDTDAWVYYAVQSLATPQLDWLKGDLSRVNRTSTPWVIVLTHRAMYCTKDADPECNEEAEAIRVGFLSKNNTFIPGIERLLVEYGVDIYIAGHTHHYMRTWPVINHQPTQKNYVNPRGPIHLQSGIGGVDGEDTFDLPMKDYDAWRDETYRRSFTRMVVHNATHISFTQRNATNGEVFDGFDVVQTNHGPFTSAA